MDLIEQQLPNYFIAQFSSGILRSCTTKMWWITWTIWITKTTGITWTTIDHMECLDHLD